ncbi:hypothetical protein AVEN_143712-1 [Araneus ventricosus]|uniref:Uncharacterized protein n=1 Tax=Araneus ventricosus TaxID=182803 RepID=A0A4Y2ANH2_ARAVE|nr:hypothetical protein AVEN_143712-1 [Araneus ventricosus]
MNFLWELLKRFVYETPIESTEELIARMSIHSVAQVLLQVVARCSVKAFDSKGSLSFIIRLDCSPFSPRRVPLTARYFFSDPTLYCESCLFWQILPPLKVMTIMFCCTLCITIETSIFVEFGRVSFPH